MISKQDDSSFPRKTIRHFHARWVVLSTQGDWSFPVNNNSHSSFWRIRPIVPGFLRIVTGFIQIWRFFCVFAKTSYGLKIARMAPISTIFGRNRSRWRDLVHLIFFSLNNFLCDVRASQQTNKRANEQTCEQSHSNIATFDLGKSNMALNLGSES